MTHTRHGCERSEQHSRATRVNESTTHQGTTRTREFRNLHNPTCPHQEFIRYQFEEIFQPAWFGTIQWQPWITQYPDAVHETSHFRNKLFCALLSTRPKKIPSPPQRPRIIFFHEKASGLINPNNPHQPRYKTIYHTHFHLEACPYPYDSWVQLDWLIRHQVAKGFHRFSTSNSSENQGFVLKPWIQEHHATYNLKDYYRYKHHQDADLPLDPENSDLEFHRD